jgi:hypothetical protein
MTSQRDETRTPGEAVTDDPIVIERRDEILTGEVPADEAPDFAGPGEDETGDDLTDSDELVGRHAAPDTGGADPAPLVVPPEAPSPDMGIPAAPSPAASTQAASSSADAPVSFDPAASGPVSFDPAAPGPAATSGPPAAWVQPGVAGTPGPAAAPGAPGSSDRDPAAGAADAGIPAAALSGQQWPAIQAMFVDDPQGSVRRAAAAADEAAKAFVASLQREQAVLRATWENDTTTEDLRTALQQYRAFCGRLEGLS